MRTWLYQGPIMLSLGLDFCWICAPFGEYQIINTFFAVWSNLFFRNNNSTCSSFWYYITQNFTKKEFSSSLLSSEIKKNDVSQFFFENLTNWELLSTILTSMAKFSSDVHSNAIGILIFSFADKTSQIN